MHNIRSDYRLFGTFFTKFAIVHNLFIKFPLRDDMMHSRVRTSIPEFRPRKNKGVNVYVQKNSPLGSQ